MTNKLTLLLSISLFVLWGCAEPVADTPSDPIDECGLCSGKSDSLGLPEDGSCGAEAMLRVANETSLTDLDDTARLNSRAAEGIVATRESGGFQTLIELDAVKYVGKSALTRIFEYADSLGYIAACETTEGFEIQIISDIDKTVLPPDSEDAYPGVVTLYDILERGSDRSGNLGDTTYVTARTEERAAGVDAWMAEVGLPAGFIHTGISGVPWLAEDEKVRDITVVLSGTEANRFLLFGDSSHRDPEAYTRIKADNPDREITALIHRVNNVNPNRVATLLTFNNHAEAAAVLVGQGILTETDAWEVYEAATVEGLELSEDEMQAYLELHGTGGN